MKPAPSSIIATRFLPMSCRSPWAVPMTTTPRLPGPAPLAGDQGLEQVEPRVHRPRREQHLGHVVLVAPELLADHVHARDEAAEDRAPWGPCAQVEPFPGLAGHRVLVAEDEGPRHGRDSRSVASLMGAPGPRSGDRRVAGLEPGGHAAGHVVPVGEARAGERADHRARPQPAGAEHRLGPIGRAPRPRRRSASAMGRWSAPSMWPSSHSNGSRTSITTRSGRSSRMVASSCTVICGTVATGRPWLSPLGHAPLEVAGDLVEADARQPLRPRGRDRSGPPTTRTIGASGRHEQPGAVRELRALDPHVERPGDVAGAVLLGAPHVEHARALVEGLPDLRRRRAAGDRRRAAGPGPGCCAMMRSKLGGFGGQPGHEPPDELVDLAWPGAPR